MYLKVKLNYKFSYSIIIYKLDDFIKVDSACKRYEELEKMYTEEFMERVDRYYEKEGMDKEDCIPLKMITWNKETIMPCDITLLEYDEAYLLDDEGQTIERLK